MARHQERCQVEQIHEHFVAVTKGKDNHLLNIEVLFYNIIGLLQIVLSQGQKLT